MVVEKFNEEFFVAVNGPSLGHCDNVIEKSMNSYWKYQGWHFFQNMCYEVIEGLQWKQKIRNKLLNDESSFNFMD